MSQEQLKGMLGGQYQYRRILTSGEVLRLQKEKPSWFTGQIAASLIAGCVRLDAVLFRDGNALRLGYDVRLLMAGIRAVNVKPGDGAEAIAGMIAAGAVAVESCS